MNGSELPTLPQMSDASAWKVYGPFATVVESHVTLTESLDDCPSSVSPRYSLTPLTPFGSVAEAEIATVPVAVAGADAVTIGGS